MTRQLVLLPESAAAGSAEPDAPATFPAFLREKSRPAWSARPVPAHLLSPVSLGGAGVAERPEAPSSAFPSFSPATLAPASPNVRYRPLGNYVNSSVAREPAADTDVMRRRERLALRAVVRRISRLKSKPQEKPASGKKSRPQYTLRRCGKVPCPRARKGSSAVSPSGHIQLRVGTSEEGGRFGYAEGVVHCGSISSCPVCAAKIRNARTVIYSESAARWLADGNSLLMVTLTFPHYAGMPLAPMWDMVSKGASHLTSSQRWRDLRKAFGGQIWYRRALEQTYGVNGWHPHCHMLIYIRGELGGRGLADVHRHFTEEWARWVTRNGYGLPSGVHGVKVEACASGPDAGSYIVKSQDGHPVGAELTRGDLKSGKKSWTPFDILRAYRRAEDAGDVGEADELRALWREFEQAAKGRRIITESRGLKKVLGEDDVTDQELADEEVRDHEDIGEITGATWRQVCERELEAPVFEALVTGGLDRVNLILDSAGLDLAYPPLDRMGGGP